MDDFEARAAAAEQTQNEVHAGVQTAYNEEDAATRTAELENAIADAIASFENTISYTVKDAWAEPVEEQRDALAAFAEVAR